VFPLRSLRSPRETLHFNIYIYESKSIHMKKFIAALLIFHFACPIIQAQNTEDLETYEKAMKPGTVLTYDVNAKDKKYQFIVTVKKLGDDIAFDWKMTDPINKNGTVSMSPEAVAK